METTNTRELSRQMLRFHRLYKEKVSKRLQTLHTGTLTQGQYFLLDIVWEAGRISMSDLAGRAMMQKQQVTNIINQLEERELVVRERSRENRRVVWVSPTKEAAALLVELTESIECELSRVLGQLSPDALEDYLDSILTINRVLEQFPKGV